MIGAVERALHRIRLMIGRGRVTTGNDSGPVQLLQVRLGELEVHDNTPRLAEYGFNSFPHPGCDALLIFNNGNRSEGVIVATGDQRYRLHLVEGEVAIHDDLGQKVHLTRNGIVIDGGGLPITVNNTPTMTINASTSVIMNTPLLKVSGDILDNYGSNTRTVYGMRTQYNLHTHTDPQGGSTGTPSAGM